VVRVFKIDAVIRKPVAGPEFRSKHKCGRPKHECGRPKCERGRYVSEAAPRFGNLCVHEPSTLRKKPSTSSEKKLSNSRKKTCDLQKKPSGLWWRRTANAFRKGIPNRGINFKDAYRINKHVNFSKCMYTSHICDNCPLRIKVSVGDTQLSSKG